MSQSYTINFNCSHVSNAALSAAIPPFAENGHNNGSATMFADSLSPEILPEGHHPLANCSQFSHHRVLVDSVIWDRLCVFSIF